jgi:carbamoyltransferase
MTILGIKLTHDGALALIKDGKLIFSYEMEKLNNLPRYSSFCISLEKAEKLLAISGYSFDTVDRVVIDGWGVWDEHSISISGKVRTISKFTANEREVEITTDNLAGYGHLINPDENILEAKTCSVDNLGWSYKSYQHVTGHICAAYCTSPFPGKRQDSFILVWDGGMPPQLFYYPFSTNEIRNLGYLFPFMGDIYIKFACAFQPFSETGPDMSVAGKAMAYMALGKTDKMVLQAYRDIYNSLIKVLGATEINIELITLFTGQFIRKAQQYAAVKGVPHENMLTTFQQFVQELLIENLAAIIAQHPALRKNLCITGGCALNIKWNSGIRNSRLFEAVWVPPFPNDSGSAIGTACCEMILVDRITMLDWSVYSGPRVNLCDNGELPPAGEDNYVPYDCSIERLAEILYKYDEPVVFLNESAELGPRALGNRSILAPAVSPAMKKRLNDMKNREAYRPVAPLCLEEYAPSIFTPGSADPYMLFEHFVKQSWKDKIPAICHLDGSARLQTVNNNENHTIYALLSAYYTISGIPLLCNTSANYNGSGFFPDVASAQKWNKANLIWNNQVLYIKKDAIRFDELVKEMPEPLLAINTSNFQ